MRGLGSGAQCDLLRLSVDAGQTDYWLGWLFTVSVSRWAFRAGRNACRS